MKPLASPVSHKSHLRQQFNRYYQHIAANQTDPVSLYLQGLAPTGRRAIKSRLITGAAILGFTGDLESMPWSVLDYQQLARVRHTLSQQGKASSTINLTLAAVRGVMKACFTLGLISANQLLLINDLRSVPNQCLPSGRCLSSRDIQKLVQTCCLDQSLIGLRDTALIGLMINTGLRRSEIVALTCCDINLRAGTLNVAAGKGNKQRQTFLGAQYITLIRQWQKRRGQSEGYLFNPISKSGHIACDEALSGQSVYDIVGTRANQAGLSPLRPHDLRRTFVTQLLDAGVDLNTTRQLAGHSDMQTTARYDMRDLKTQKKAIQQLFST
jgi:site-specific recombinase XerD